LYLWDPHPDPYDEDSDDSDDEKDDEYDCPGCDYGPEDEEPWEKVYPWR
jgi:hypothetical protein